MFIYTKYLLYVHTHTYIITIIYICNDSKTKTYVVNIVSLNFCIQNKQRIWYFILRITCIIIISVILLDPLKTGSCCDHVLFV